MKILVSLGLSLVVGIASVVALPATASAQSADVSKPGVYANTDAGVVTLSAFYSGVMTSLPVAEAYPSQTTMPSITRKL